MRFLSLLFPSACVVSSLIGQTRAAVTDFTINPPNPVMGEIVLYSAVLNNQPPISVTSYKWEYNFAGPCGPNWYTGMSTTSTWSVAEWLPGTWQVRLTVNYAPTGFPQTQPPPTIIVKNVTIAPPTHLVISGGLNIRTGYTSPITMRFRVMSGARPCGPMLGGLIQELITDRTFLSPPFPSPWGADDTEWTPATHYDPTKFYREGNEIVDIKTQADLAFELWAAIPTAQPPAPPTDYYSIRQSFRLKYTDPCGAVQIIPLGSFTLSRVKVSGGSWEMSYP